MTEAPEHGARFELTREDGSARYAIVVHAPGTTFEASASLDASAIDVRWTSEPPRWIADTTLGFVKTLHKNHGHDASWPSRLVRWRSERG